jgi:hypothetical protein
MCESTIIGMRLRTTLAFVTFSALLAVPGAVSAQADSGDLYRVGVTAPQLDRSSRVVDKVRFTVDPDTSRFEVFRNGVVVKSGVVVSSKRTYSLYMSINKSGITETLQYFYETTLPRLSNPADVYQVVTISRAKVRSKAFELTRNEMPGRFAQVGFERDSAVLSTSAMKALDRAIASARSAGLKKLSVIANHSAQETSDVAEKRGEVIAAYLTARLNAVLIDVITHEGPSNTQDDAKNRSAYVATAAL